MIKPNYAIVRDTAQSVTTAVAIAIPELGVTAKPEAVGIPQALPGDNICELMDNLNLKKHLQHRFISMQYIQSGDQRTPVDPDYGQECINFRVQLKGVVSDFLSIISIVPALSSDDRLIDNLETAGYLIDYIPPRCLYLMWKTLGSQMERIRKAVNRYGQDLAVVPPLKNFTVFNEETGTYEMDESANSIHKQDPSTWSVFTRPFVELFKARLEMYAYRLNSYADLIPDNIDRKEDAEKAFAQIVINNGEQLCTTDELIAINQ